MTSRERVFRALESRTPDRAPRNLWALPWVSMYAQEELQAVLRDFPDDFTGPGAVLAPSKRRSGTDSRKGRYVDDWGSVWEVAEDGVVGEVKQPPLAVWSALCSYQPPWEMIEQADWDQVNRAQEANLQGDAKFMLCGTTIRPFERMQFLRGSENLFVDLGYGTRDVYSDLLTCPPAGMLHLVRVFHAEQQPVTRLREGRVGGVDGRAEPGQGASEAGGAQGLEEHLHQVIGDA